jgi:hypothetical protein
MNITENRLARLTDSQLYKQQELLDEEEYEALAYTLLRPAYPIDPSVWMQTQHPVEYERSDLSLSQICADRLEIENELDRRAKERWDKLCAEVQASWA